MDELTRDFVAETYDSLQQLEQIVLGIEDDASNMDLIRDAFRLLHTIKGTCGFLGFSRMQSVSHRAENVLSQMRDGVLIPNTTTTSTLFVALDTIRQIVDHIESTGSESSGNDEDLLLALDKCLVKSGDAPSDQASKAQTSEAQTPDEDLNHTEIAEQELTVADEHSSPEKKGATEQVEEAQKTLSVIDSPSESSGAMADTTPAPAPVTTPQESKGSAAQSIRINLDVVDNLMALVGELVLTRNQLLQQNEDHDGGSHNNVLTRLSHLTSELQQNIMKTRMQPIESAWTKLPRLVRDISGSLQKKIVVKQIGGDTELDRQVIELIKDPLVHMVRNSADHGIEMPEVRIQNGKNEVGTITLKSYNHGGHIVIEISDDGKGIDPVVIREKAVAKNLLSTSESERLNDEQILQMIFKPGFSTAETISNISGRGVGMDVVRANLDKLGGTIEMKSKKGQGSTFVMKIPLTLSIISVLIIKVEKYLFAVPQLSITEILSLKQKNASCIEYVQDKPLLRWRNQLLPLVFLSNMLNIDHSNDLASHHVIVLQMGPHYFGLLVDSIHDSQEIVVKPLSRKLAHLSTFSGSTILGTGDVVLILDPNNFPLQLESTNAKTADTSSKSHYEEATKSTLILLFQIEDSTKAVPLALVGRIDELEGSEIQKMNDQYLFLYRDKLIPILGIKDDPSPEDLMPVLIFFDRGYKVALKIDEILDIVEDSTEIQLESDQTDSLGTAVIKGKATTIIDCQSYFKKAYPHWQQSRGPHEEVKHQRRLLLVDDSTFFLNLISPLLKVSGYCVETASGADQALSLCKSASIPFDVIISDIEMPDKTGYDFLRELREDQAFDEIPVVALSGRDTEEEIQKAKDAGFKAFVPKTDQQNLIRVLAQF